MPPEAASKRQKHLAIANRRGDKALKEAIDISVIRDIDLM
jgi:hypothetical protein